MYSKRFLTTLMVAVVCLIVLIPTVSGFEFDNVKDSTSITFDGKQIKDLPLLEKYAPIKITNAFGLGATLFEGYISQHNETCGIDCSSTMEIKTGQDGVLVDDVEFRTLQEEGNWIEQNVRSYQFKYFGDVEDFEKVCEEDGISKNGSIKYSCSEIKTGSHKGWINYNLGDEVPEGIYTVKLDANKKPSRTVDWVIKTNGEWLESWATWGNITEGDDAEVVLNSPADNYILLTNPQFFNATATITGGATITNMSLWTNESGSWTQYNDSYGATTVNQSYDTFGDASINTSLWTMAKVDGGNYGETGGYIWVSGTSGGGADSASATSNNLPAIGLIDYVYIDYSLAVSVSFTCGSSSGVAFGGMPGVSISCSGDGCSNSDVGVIEYIRSGDKFEFYKNGIYVSNNTPSTNVITLSCGAINNGHCDSKMYDTKWSGDDSRLWGTSAEFIVNRTITDTTLWNVQACDSDGDCGFSTANRILLIDIDEPTTTLQSPTGTLDYGVVDENETLNVTFTDTNLDTCWYDYNGTNITIDGCVSGVKNSTNFILEYDNTNITIWANDSVGNYNGTVYSWDYLIFENSQTYPTISLESATETYIANLTYDSSSFGVITGKLILNGTEYTGTRTGSGNNAILTTSTIMPSISAETNFTGYWTISLTNSTGTTDYNLTSHNVTVSIIDFGLCDDTLTVPFWNYTILNETNGGEINSTFEGTFTIRQTGGTATNEFYYSDTNGTNSTFDFCISPGTESYTIYTNIKLTKTGYVDKFYNYEEVIVTNATREDNLYMLTSEDSTSFIIHVVSVSGLDIDDAEVRVQRYYPGTGEWLTTEIVTTNYVGEAIGHLLSEDADYRFKIYQEGISTYNSTSTKIICTVAPCTVTLIIPTTILPGYEEVEDIDSTLTFSTTTNVFTYTYSDTSGLFSRARLQVFRVWPSNATMIMPCNETKTTSSGVMTCDISGGINGTYQASGYIIRDAAEFLDKRINRNLGTNIFNAIGLDGILWSIFIFMGIIMIGITRPSMAIIFGAVGIITLSLIGLINIGAISIVSIVAIAIILLMRVGRE